MEERRRRRIVWISAAVMALFVFGNNGFQTLMTQWLERRRLVATISRLKTEHEDLSRQLAAIQKDPAYTEYWIRKTLGYAKKGEVEYRLIKDDKKRS